MDEPIKQVVSVGRPTKVASTSDQPTFYANVATLGMSPEEIVMNFGLVDPADPNEAKGVVKIYLTAGHARRLAKALAAALNQYELLFGTIMDNHEDYLISSPEEEADEREWEEKFAATSDEKLNKLVAKVRATVQAGKIRPLDFTNK